MPKVKLKRMIKAANQDKKGAAQPKKISWSEFQNRYLSREDKYKYEWLNGVIEKTERSMNFTQLFILVNLIDFFEQLKLSKKADGALISEPDSFFLENHRRPDIAYFSRAQIARTAHGENQVPQFVIEVISKNDKIQKTQRKVQDYHGAGVQVIWQLLPELEEVNVYHGNNIMICRGEAICSAAPVLPDFELPASAIFQKPTLLED